MFEKYKYSNIKCPVEYNHIYYPRNKFDYRTVKLPNINKYDLNTLINANYEYLKNKGYENIILNILTLLKTYYQIDSYDDLFKECINNTNILLDNISTQDLGKKIGYKIPEEVDGYYISTKPTMDFKNYTCKKNKNIILIGDCSKKSNLLIFDQLAHEIRHSLTNIKDSNIFIDDTSFYERIGLTEILTDINKYSLILNDLLDEFYNTYFTELIVNEILKYKNIEIENVNIKEYLSSLRNPYRSGYYYSLTYQELRILCYPLLFNKELTQLTKDITMNGDIEKLYDYYDYKNVDFEEFANKVEDYDSNIGFIKKKSLILGGITWKEKNL